MLLPALCRATAFSLLLFTGTGCSTGKKEVREPITSLYSVRDPQFRRGVQALATPALVPGNRVTTLRNGDEIFPAMLRAIRGARRSINLETYIYWSGQIGREFAVALAERARAGVQVRLILDWQGTTRMSAEDRSLLESAGAQIVAFNPLRWYDPRRVNNRTHRKLLVVDGRIGFTGGVGIADVWSGHAQDPEHWRDNHYRIDGPAVAQLQGAFMDNWIKSRGEVLHGDLHFPAIPTAGSALAGVTRSSPGRGNPVMRMLFLYSLAGARQSIKIVTPYFVPDPLLIRELVEAKKRGVRVQVLAPGRYIDSKLTRATSRAVWGDLLQAGVEIHEYRGTMLHAKLLIVDDYWCSVGSANFDARSMRLNDEANLNVLDAGFARRQAALFAQDLARSRRITHAEWAARPLTEKVLTPVYELIKPEL